uniref:Uncharacterized protein n=1 Tax=Anguilla anguilla TaxID=7936 RepID=A0A0E9WCY9_ANGAN
MGEGTLCCLSDAAGTNRKTAFDTKMLQLVKIGETPITHYGCVDL